MNLIRIIIVALSAVITFGFANSAEIPNMPTNGSALIGKIWSTKTKRFVAPLEMTRELKQAKYVLLGEVHDNANHHRIQAWIVANIGTKSALVMEMIRSDQAQALQEYLESDGANAAGLGPAIEWQSSGWPQWSEYQPIIEAALEQRMPIVAASPSKSVTRKIGRKGLSSIFPEQQRKLALDQSLSGELDEALNEEIKISHCDLLPQSMIPTMAFVQRFRDASFARAMVDAAGRGQAQKSILIAGNGHVRNDRAVPWYLSRQDKGARIGSVILLEVDNAKHSKDELIALDGDGLEVADYYWFTNQAEREDQCAKLRKQFGKK